jgi:hypothetical protein
MQKKAKYYAGLLRCYGILQETDPSIVNVTEQDKIFNALMNFNTEEELLEGANYFFNSISGTLNESLILHYCSRAILMLKKSRSC